MHGYVWQGLQSEGLVCDAYEAMTADRTYRKAMSSEVAVEELERCAGAQFDPDVVAAFRALTDQLPDL
ncbi:MAG: hypothetical protein EHM24_08135, partial [Acidobacteria bacterium]